MPKPTGTKEYEVVAVPVQSLRQGDMFWDCNVRTWLEVTVGASAPPFSNKRRSPVVWEADGHDYYSPTVNSSGDQLYVLVRRYATPPQNK